MLNWARSRKGVAGLVVEHKSSVMLVVGQECLRLATLASPAQIPAFFLSLYGQELRVFPRANQLDITENLIPNMKAPPPPPILLLLCMFSTARHLLKNSMCEGESLPRCLDISTFVAFTRANSGRRFPRVSKTSATTHTSLKFWCY